MKHYAEESDSRVQHLLAQLEALEVINNRTEPGYQARFWVRTERTRLHRGIRYLSVYRCAEYQYNGHTPLQRRSGRGSILCFIDTISGKVLAKRKSRLTLNDLPGNYVYGNLNDSEPLLAKLKRYYHIYSDPEHAHLKVLVNQHLSAEPGKLVDVGSGRVPCP